MVQTQKAIKSETYFASTWPLHVPANICRSLDKKTKVTMDLITLVFVFPHPPPRMDVVRVGKVGHNCREVLRWRRSRDPLLLLFPRINHYCSRPRILQKKLFLFWPRPCQRQLLLRLSPVRAVFLPQKLDF